MLVMVLFVNVILKIVVINLLHHIQSYQYYISHLIYDFNIQYDNNELSGITKTKFTKMILIIDFFLTKTIFVVRLIKKSYYL
jgi:hypothetical protein